MPLPSEPAERLEARRIASRRLSDLPLVWVTASTVVGMLLEQIVWPNNLSPAWLLIGVPMLLVSWAITHRVLRNVTAAWLLLASITCLAASWSGMNCRTFSTNEIGRYADRDAGPVCLEGIVVTSPLHFPAEQATPFHAIPPSDQSVVQIEVTRLRNGETWIPTSGQCEVRLAGKADFLSLGCHAQLFGQLRKPSCALNPGERDAARVSRMNRRLALVWCESPACASIILKADQTNNLFFKGLHYLRQSANNTLAQYLTKENAPLASAMLLGNPSGLSRSTTEAFRKTGTLHVLVVSGLHVGLVAGLPLLLGALGLLPMRTAQGLSLGLVIFYAVLVGTRPPALRAAILAGGAVVAAMVRRHPLGMNSLGGAAVTLFATSPGAFEAAGTKLSFLAAATLLGFGTIMANRARRPKPPLMRLIERTRLPAIKAMRSFAHWCGLLLLATFAVLIVTGPLIASEFHLLSPAALLLAIPVMLSVALVIPSGLILMTFAVTAAALPAAMVSAITWLPAMLGNFGLTQLSEIVNQTATLPYSFFYTPGPARWWVGLWYLLLTLVAVVEYGAPRFRGVALRLGLALVAAAFVPGWIESISTPNQLRFSAIAVGHGSSMLIEAPGGEVILYDAGSLGSPGRSTEIISRVLWSRGIQKIDAVILSHSDVDHYNAMPGLMERFSIGSVWTTRVMFDPWEANSPNSGPVKLEAILNEQKIPVRLLALGDLIQLGNDWQRVKLEVLHPTELGVFGSDNANSLVLGIEFLDKRIILTGDVESPGLEHLLATEPYPCELLLAPHHGSERSNPPGLIEWCHPQRVLISSGHHHPSTEAAYGRSGAEIMNTHEMGMITTLVDSTGVRWMSHLLPEKIKPF